MRGNEVIHNGHNGAARPAHSGQAAPSKRAEPQPIQIEFRDEKAQAVAIIGTFNQWKSSDTHMVRVQPGRWVRVLFLPPGRHEYLLVVDDRCIADPNAVETVPNVYGCVNSVLTVRAIGKNCARLQFAAGRQTPRTSRRSAGRRNKVSRFRAGLLSYAG